MSGGVDSSVCAALAAPAFAHHGFGRFDPTKEVTIEGTLTGIDFVNQYMFRGIRQNSSGIATWPYIDLGFAAFEGDGGLKSVGINVGSWNSAHSEPSGWYESDVYATVGFGFGGGVSLGTTYTSYTSPNDSFTHVKELGLKLALDDSAYMGGGALSPYVLFAFEMATEPGRYQADGGENAGVRTSAVLPLAQDAGVRVLTRVECGGRVALDLARRGVGCAATWVGGKPG